MAEPPDPGGMPDPDAYEIRDRGQMIGMVVRGDDGSVTSCIHRNCARVVLPNDPDRGRHAVAALLDEFRALGYQVQPVAVTERREAGYPETARALGGMAAIEQARRVPSTGFRWGR